MKNAILFLLILATLAISVDAQKGSGKTVWDGVYSAAQAKRGANTYAEQCAVCHGSGMTGGLDAPSLTGTEFLFSWKNKTAGELFTFIKTNMPPGQSGNLSDQRCAELLAAIFEGNKFPAGATTELPSNAQALGEILITESK